MNPIQKQWLALGATVMLAMLIYPPWTRITHQVVLGTDRSLIQTESQEFAGYSLLFEPPSASQLAQPVARPGDHYETVSIALDRFLLQWLTVAFLTGAGLLYFKDSDKKSLGEWSGLFHPPRSRPPPHPPVSGSPVPPVIGASAATQTAQANERSPWRRAKKPAGTAFGIGSFVGIASACQPSVQKGFSFGEGMFFAFCFGLFCGLLLAAVTFVVAGLYFGAKGAPEVAALPDGSKAGKKTQNLVWVGILAIMGVLCAIGVAKPCRDALSYAFADPDRDEQSPASQPAASPAGETKELDPRAQKAAEFDRDFFLNYPDLIPYRTVVDAVATKLSAQGFTAPTREAVMEAFAKGAREEIARQQGATPTHADQPNAATLGWRYENGSGVRQDYAKAAYWYRQAAEQGDASAQNNLGKLFEMGRGVAQDPVAAVIWYGASAAQGSSAAQSNLTNLVPRLTPDQQRELGRRMRAALDAIPPATSPK